MARLQYSSTMSQHRSMTLVAQYFKNDSLAPQDQQGTMSYEVSLRVHTHDANGKGYVIYTSPPLHGVTTNEIGMLSDGALRVCAWLVGVAPSPWQQLAAGDEVITKTVEAEGINAGLRAIKRLDGSYLVQMHDHDGGFYEINLSAEEPPSWVMDALNAWDSEESAAVGGAHILRPVIEWLVCGHALNHHRRNIAAISQAGDTVFYELMRLAKANMPDAPSRDPGDYSEFEVGRRIHDFESTRVLACSHDHAIRIARDHADKLDWSAAQWHPHKTDEFEVVDGVRLNIDPNSDTAYTIKHRPASEIPLTVKEAGCRDWYNSKGDRDDKDSES